MTNHIPLKKASKKQKAQPKTIPNPVEQDMLKRLADVDAMLSPYWAIRSTYR